MKYLFAILFIMATASQMITDYNVRKLTVQLALDESELKEQHKHIDLIGGGIQTLSYETDVLTESIKGLHLGQ